MDGRWDTCHEVGKFVLSYLLYALLVIALLQNQLHEHATMAVGGLYRDRIIVLETPTAA
jgi:hypothetical protein